MLAATLLLLVVLVASGVALMWLYRPEPGGPTLVRTVHRSASALLVPASWLLVLTMVRHRWGAGRRSTWVRWSVPVALVVAVVLAAFTGFLLPWQELHLPAVVVPPDLAGMGVAFDPQVASVDFGGEPISRTVYQRYVLAHFALAAAVVALVAFVARTAALRAGGRTRGGRGSPRPGTGSAPSPRTRA